MKGSQYHITYYIIYKNQSILNGLNRCSLVKNDKYHFVLIFVQAQFLLIPQ